MGSGGTLSMRSTSRCATASPCLPPQVHPVVSRLCAPIEGTDGAHIADCLGLDPARFRGGGGAAGGSSGGGASDEYAGCASALDDEANFVVRGQRRRGGERGREEGREGGGVGGREGAHKAHQCMHFSASLPRQCFLCLELVRTRHAVPLSPSPQQTCTPSPLTGSGAPAAAGQCLCRRQRLPLPGHQRGYARPRLPRVSAAPA